MLLQTLFFHFLWRINSSIWSVSIGFDYDLLNFNRPFYIKLFLSPIDVPCRKLLIIIEKESRHGIIF